MYKHTADRSFAESLEYDASENAGKPESMEKKDFLAMFELVPSDELCGSKANEEVLETISKEQNNRYFAQLCRAYAKNKAKQNHDAECKSEPSNESMADRFSPSHVPSTINENQMLIPSTDIPDDPSMSPPPEVFSAVAAQDGVIPIGLFPSHLSKSMFPKREFFGQEDLSLSSSPILHAGSFISPLHSSSLLLGMDGDAAQGQKKGAYKCKFCGNSFPNERTLKSKCLFSCSLFGRPSPFQDLTRRFSLT